VTVITTSAFGRSPDDERNGVVRTRDVVTAAGLRRLLRRPPLEQGAAAQADKPAGRLLTGVVVPDSYALSWLPFAIGAARRLMRQSAVDCVITSSPPDSVHLAGLALGRERPAWIADLRDGWRFEPLRPPFPTGFQERLDARLEGRVTRTADGLTAATQPIAADLENRLGAPAALVPNAWDPDFERAVEAAAPPELPPGKFNFVHTGTLSGRWGRDPRPLLRALRDLIDERPAIAESVRLVLVGGMSEEDRRTIAELEVGDLVHEAGSLPRAEAIALQRSANALVLVTSSNVGEATGKLFEYLAAGKPILALATGNEAARIIEETGTGVAVDPNNGAAVLQAVTDAVDGKLQASYAPRALDRYVYPGPANTLAEVVETVISAAGRSL
jgi:glycosyltransferase involved in cell wall biosynthesis